MASAHEQHHLPIPYGSTAAPPPTPSTQPNHLSTSAAADTLSLLLHRLPPTLSLPACRSSPLATTSPSLICLSDPTSSLHTNLLSASDVGFFQLTNHSIPTQLAVLAESESLALFNLPHDQKKLQFPKNWPLGFDDDDEDEPGTCVSFCFDSSCSSESSELTLTSLSEFTHEMEKVGIRMIEALSSAVGFENPIRENPTRICSLMWVSEASPGNKPATLSKLYPYVVGLQYQLRSQKSTMLADSGWISVSTQVDSILVTFGDIAQVWSNGKLKKVRGRPMPSLGDHGKSSTSCVSMTLLMTLPLDSTVNPLFPEAIINVSEVINKEEDDRENADEVEDIKRQFNSFSFEDYAWRVYHERLLLKDPLDRYRT